MNDNINIENEQADLSEFIVFDFKKADFSLTQTGVVNLVYDSKEYMNVNFKRLMPFYEPYKYISVLCDDNEIAIIDDINNADEKQAELIKSVLEKRYFCPSILKILSVKEKMGYLYLDLNTSAGKKKICVGDFSSNIRHINANDVVFIDIEGNRYKIDDYDNFDKASKQKMEIFF